MDFDEDDFIAEAERRGKQNFLREEIIDLGYDGELFTEFFNNKTGHGDIDQISFDEVADIVREFKSNFRPGQTAEAVAEERRRKEAKEQKLYQMPSLPVSHAHSSSVPPPSTATEPPAEQQPEDTGDPSRESEHLPGEQSRSDDAQKLETSKRSASEGGILAEELKAPEQPQRFFYTEQCQVAPRNELSDLDQIEISIKDLEVVPGGFFSSEYCIYIVVTQPVNWVARRTFEHFQWLHDTLATAFPGVCIPPVPPKNMRGRLNNDTHEKKERLLNKFIRRVASNALLVKSAYSLAFLSATSPKEFEAATKKWKKLRRPTTVSRLQSFTGFVDCSNQDIMEYTTKLNKFLSDSDILKKRLKAETEALFGHFENLSNALRHCSSLFEQLFEIQWLNNNSTPGKVLNNALHQSFYYLSDFDLQMTTTVSLYIEEFALYSQLQNDALRAFLKEFETLQAAYLKNAARGKASEEERKFFDYFRAQILKEVRRSLQENFTHDATHFTRMAEFESQHVKMLFMVASELTNNLAHGEAAE